MKLQQIELPTPFPNLRLSIYSRRIISSFALTLFLFLFGFDHSIGKPIEMKSEFHQKCSFCHIPSSDPKEPPLWYQNIEPDYAISQKSSDMRNNIYQSKVCLTCHDGRIARDQGVDYREEEPRPSGTHLGKNHPVNVDYVTAFSKRGPRKLHHPAMLGPLKLYAGKVECGTCHDTHQSFRLRTSKADLCFRCHNM